MPSRQDDIERIAQALQIAQGILKEYTPGKIAASDKGGAVDFDPVTEADTRVNDALKTFLHKGDDGWLSEETADDPARLGRQRVWVVDPLDGTREFVAGIPEWSVSIGLVENGHAVAGGVCNPQTGETMIGSPETGVTYNGRPAQPSQRTSLAGGLVPASRSELKRGEWDRFQNCGFEIRPTGSVAYKLAMVAAGRADAAWTLCPKHEWDVAAGVALVQAVGGIVVTLDGSAPSFNQPDTLLSGLIATPRPLAPAVADLLRIAIPTE